MADDKPSSTAEAELPPATREAIRAYMIKLILPSAIVGAVLGYVVSGLARLDASGEAAKHATAAAEKAIEAATEAKSSNARAADAVKSAEEAQKFLEKAKSETNDLLTGRYATFSESLFATKDFRDKLGRLGDQQFIDLNAKIDALSTNLRGGILAAGVVKGGKLVVSTDGVSFDTESGKISFANGKNTPFITIVSAISPNGQYLTGSCYTRSTGPDYFILWQGAQDTSGRNNAPTDCTFTVVGSKQ
jgi:hypothetical protein